MNYKQGYLDDALDDFRKVLELDPQNADARKSIEIIEKTQKQAESKGDSQ